MICSPSPPPHHLPPAHPHSRSAGRTRELRPSAAQVPLLAQAPRPPPAAPLACPLLRRARWETWRRSLQCTRGSGRRPWSRPPLPSRSRGRDRVAGSQAPGVRAAKWRRPRSQPLSPQRSRGSCPRCLHGSATKEHRPARPPASQRPGRRHSPLPQWQELAQRRQAGATPSAQHRKQHCKQHRTAERAGAAMEGATRQAARACEES